MMELFILLLQDDKHNENAKKKKALFPWTDL